MVAGHGGPQPLFTYVFPVKGAVFPRAALIILFAHVGPAERVPESYDNWEQNEWPPLEAQYFRPVIAF